MNDSNRIRKWLQEDLSGDAAQDQNIDELLPYMQTLRSVSEPRLGEMEFVRDALLAEIDTNKSSTIPRLQSSFIWLLLRSQIRIVKSEIWLATLLVMVIGTLITLSRESFAGETHPLVMFAPLVAAGGIAFLYGNDIDPPLEILMTMPVTPRLVLLGRLFLVFGFNLCLGIASSLVLFGIQGELSLWALIVSWLVPMTFLSALAFFIAVMTQEPLLGALLSFGLWLLQFVDVAYLRYPDLAAPEFRPLLLMVAVVLGGLSLWLAGQENYWVSGKRPA